MKPRIIRDMDEKIFGSIEENVIPAIGRYNLFSVFGRCDYLFFESHPRNATHCFVIHLIQEKELTIHYQFESQIVK